jgi:hypothetical protein
MEAVKQGSCAVGLVVSQETSLLEAAGCMLCERQQFLLCTRQRMLSSIQAAAPRAGVHLVGRTFVSPRSVSTAVLMLVVCVHVCLQSKTHVVLATLKRAQNDMSSYQRKMFKVDDHMGIAIAGLTADGRVLCKYMRNECINHRYTAAVAAVAAAGACSWCCLCTRVTHPGFSRGVCAFRWRTIRQQGGDVALQLYCVRWCRQVVHKENTWQCKQTARTV